jgi:hypothetical protein
MSPEFSPKTDGITSQTSRPSAKSRDREPAAGPGSRRSWGLPLFLGGRHTSEARAMQRQLGTGHPLDAAVRSRAESAWGDEFSDVRVHTDARARHLTARVDARAATVGNDIAFGPGEYRPGTPLGDLLIAHELAHVAQQKAGGRLGDGAHTASDDALEADSNRSAASAILSRFQIAAPRLRSGLRVARCSRTDNPKATGTHYDQGQIEMWMGKPREELKGAFPELTIDASATREEITANLQAMNAGGTYVFFGHGGYEEGEMRGINPSSGKGVRGPEMTKALSADANPPTLVILGACGSAALLDDVVKGGVPVAVGFSDKVSGSPGAAAVAIFMKELNAGSTFNDAKNKADAVASLLIPAEVMVRYAPGYDGNMTLEQAKTKHQAALVK